MKRTMIAALGLGLSVVTTGCLAQGGDDLRRDEPNGSVQDSHAVLVGGGGSVMPAGATPNGYDLAAMAAAGAQFTTSGNDLAYYPVTPFQILYTDWSATTIDVVGEGAMAGLSIQGGNDFQITAGTSFYVPLFNSDDSPPIVGAFPSSADGAAAYFFEPSQLGGSYEIEVDGLVTELGGAYVAGPVETAPLPDGGGTHIITIGAFLSSMSAGEHTVTIRGSLDGDAMAAALGLAYADFELAYHITVTGP